MIRRYLSALFFLIGVSCVCDAQTTVIADRFRLTTGCILSSGTGSPEGVVVAGTCAMYIDTATGVWYTKWTPTGSTGWGVGHNANARVNGTLDVTGYVGEPTYVSQLTTWRVTNGGAADFRYLFTDELHAKSFIADLEQALAGGQIICKSVAMLGSNFTNPATGGTATLTVRDLPSAENQAAFQSGDYVGLRTFSRSAGALTIGDTFGVVTAYADQAGGVQTWTYTRGSGANGGGLATSTVIATDAIVIDYGVSGNGCHEINAIDGANGINSPYAQTWTWTTSPIAANRVFRTRVGNERGITSVANEYGLIAGSYAATNGQYLRATNTAFELHGIDVSLWQGSTKTFFVDHAVPSLALGASVPSSYGTGTGIWMGNDGGTYKLRAGVPGGAGMFWDGATLTVRGTQGSGTNQLANSECRVGTDGWTIGNTHGLSESLGFNLDPWRLNAESTTCYVIVTGTPANGTATFISAPRFVVKPGSRYELSVYLGLQSVTNSQIYIAWYDSAGAFISQELAANVCTPAGGSGGYALASYCRSGMVSSAAPSGAFRGEPIIRTVYNGSGVDPATFFVRAFVGEATSTQTLLSEWGPAGLTEITGGLIRTGTIFAQHIAANTITAAKIAAGTITATEIAAATITAAKIVSGTITATQIATNTITADRMNVSSLSAISANIGTVTAGSISGVTITGGTIDIGGGNFTVSGSGILFLGGPTTIDATLIVDNLEDTALAGGGTRYVCVDDGGVLFAAASC